MKHTHLTTPSGEEFVLVSRSDFERLQDLFDTDAHGRTADEIARGKQERLSADEVRAALGAVTPLAFWRRRRGFTQKALSAEIGVLQSYVADLESGRRKGDPLLIKRLAKALKVRMEDLVADANDGE